MTTINNVPMIPAEMSIVLSEMSNDIVRHSCELARELRDKGMNVLLLNCATSNGRFRNVADLVIRARSYQGRTHCRVRSVVEGNLIGEKDYIETFAHTCNMSVLIICGWEWTSSTYRRKTDLMYYLRGLMERHGVSVVIYSQARTNPVPGRYDRGGLGRIAEVALYIIRLETASDIYELVPPPPPIEVEPEEWDKAGKYVKLLVNNINDLQPEKVDGRVL